MMSLENGSGFAHGTPMPSSFLELVPTRVREDAPSTLATRAQNGKSDCAGGPGGGPGSSPRTKAASSATVAGPCPA